MKSHVVVTSGKAKEAAIKALERLDPKVTGANILIKPNLASKVKDRGENTDVRVVEGIIEHFHDKGDITIAEGCCGATGLTPNSTHELFEFAGYSKLENKYGVELHDLNTDSFEKAKLYDKVFGVAKTALNADYLISVPALKTHEFTTISACVKNLMGCLEPKPPPEHETATKWQIHAELSVCDFSDIRQYWSALNKFEHRLVALCEKLSPKLGVVDAIVASEGDAPVHGTPVHMGLVLASENLVSCDAVAAYLMGIDPKTIGFLRLAKKRGLGEIDVDGIETNVRLERYRKRLRLPSFLDYLHESRISRPQRYL